MLKHRNYYDEEFKRNTVKLSYASPKKVREIAKDLGIAKGILYNWRKKYTAKGDKTPTASMQDELESLRLVNTELKIECDILKKAAVYFAKH
jgi:transposase